MGKGRQGAPARRDPLRSDRGSTCGHALEDEAGDRVRVAVGVRPTILGIALAVAGDLPRDADARAAVGHAVAELVVRGGLVGPGEAALDVGAVADDVGRDALADGLAGRLDRLVALAHRL